MEYQVWDSVTKSLWLFLRTLFCTLALSWLRTWKWEAKGHLWGHSNKLRRGSCGKQQANNYRGTEAYNNHVRGLEEKSKVKPSNDCNPGQQPKPNCDFMNDLWARDIQQIIIFLSIETYEITQHLSDTGCF